MVDKLFIATKGLIQYNGKILLLRESAKYTDGTQMGKFDVVGGRLNPGEAYDDSLRREIKEETGLSVSIGSPFFVNEVRPIVRNEVWQIVRVFFTCEATTDIVMLGSDHDEYVWIDPAKFREYPIIENLIPVFEAFLQK